MANCNSCGTEVKESYKFCPACNAELPRVQPSSGNNLASDSVIMGDQFSGTKADTIIINQYAPNVPYAPQGNPTPVSHNPSNNGCSRCKKSFSSEQLLNCIDSQCGNSMCYSCYQLWQVHSIPEWQYCQEHTTKMKAEHEANCKKCSSCQVSLAYGKQSGSCEYEGCNNSMCMDCYLRWFVANPSVQYRSNTSNWNYCESHTKLSIEKAELELQHRFGLLNQYCTQNWEQWVRERRDYYVQDANNKLSNIEVILWVIIPMTLVIFFTDQWFGLGLNGFWYWVYQIGCFWVPLAFTSLGLFGIFIDDSNQVTVQKSIAIKRQESIEIPYKEFNFGIGKNNGDVLDWDPINNQIIMGDEYNNQTYSLAVPAAYFYRLKEEAIQ